MIPHRFTVVGGAHIDRRGRIEGPTSPAASNPGLWFEEAGGGGFNAARSLARLGHDVEMISMRGGDAAGELVEDAAAAAGLRYTPFTFLDRSTPSYTAILEADGNLVIALADMALYDIFLPRRLQIRAVRDRIAASRALVCDANLPAQTLTALSRTAASAEIPLAAIAVSPAKVIRLKEALPRLTFLFMNEAEARAISGRLPASPLDWPEIMRDIGLTGGVITRGKEATIGWIPGNVAALAPPPVDVIGDVTGAGDGFAAGFLHAFSQGLELGEMMRHGAASARLAVLSPFATATDLSPDRLNETLALVPQPQLLA